MLGGVCIRISLTTGGAENQQVIVNLLAGGMQVTTVQQLESDV